MKTTYTQAEVRQILENLQLRCKRRFDSALTRHGNETEDYWKGVAEGEMTGYENMRFAIETEMINVGIGDNANATYS